MGIQIREQIGGKFGGIKKFPYNNDMSFRFDDFEFNPERFELAQNGKTLPAEPKVLSVLSYLLENHDRLVTKDELVEKIWEGRAISDWTLTGCVKSARQLLADTEKEKKYIKTVHGRGFRFVGDVHAVGVEMSTVPKNTKATRGDQPVVAILPFDNMSADPEQEYLIDGICEDIITFLSNIPGLDVIARNSTFKYKGQSVDVREVGKELEASHVLEGSIRCIGNRVRITAQLINSSDGTHVWAERYDRDLSDIFALQDEITRDIVSALHVELVAGERAQYWARGTENFEAWTFQLRALQLISTHEKESVRKGRELALQAAKLDPKYAEPWVSLAISFHIELGDCWDDEIQIVLAKLFEAVDNALARDPDNPYALATKGSILAAMGKYEEGFAMCQRGYELANNSPDVASLYIFGSTFAGKFEQAGQAVTDLSRDLDELDAWHLNMLANHLLVIGKPEKAVDIATLAIQRSEKYTLAYVSRVIACVELSQMEEARETVRQLRQVNTKYTASYFSLTVPCKDRAVGKEMVENLIRAGLPE